MKKPSIKDIADSLGVSKTLVSFVLNNRGDENGISKETQRKVLEKVAQLKYHPNFIARGLRLGRSHTIGLIVTDISNIFYARIAKRIEEVAAKHKYNLIYCSSGEDEFREIELIRMLRERQVDGMIISTTQKNGRIFSELKKEHYPFVLIDRNLPKLKANYCGVDNFSGAYTATDKLIKNGLSKIALLKISPDYLSTIKNREQGYRKAFKDNGLRINNKLIRTIDCNNIKQEVPVVLQELISSNDRIDAIFSVNNSITVACLEFMYENNIKIPDDMGLISFDDIDLFSFSIPKISAIAQPIEEIGEAAVTILLEEMDSKTNNNHQVTLPVKFIQRGSCGTIVEKQIKLSNN